jgi:hypothetical protein
MLRLGALGAAGAVISTAASSSVMQLVPGPQGLDPLAPAQPRPPATVQTPSAPAGIDPQLFARAKAALDQHQIYARDSIGIVDFSQPSNEKRFHVVNLASGNVDSYRVAHGRGSDPEHSGYLQRFSNDFGSYATSNGTYVTTDYYDGKYGLSLRVRGLDWSNNNAEARAIVIHNAWYAEDDMIPLHGQLGRSEGCFAMSRKNQYEVMRKLAGGRMIYADKLA